MLNVKKIVISGTARAGSALVARMLGANKSIHVATTPFLEIFRFQIRTIYSTQ